MKCELSYSLEVQNPGLSDITGAVLQLVGFLRDHGVMDEKFVREFSSIWCY